MDHDHQHATPDIPEGGETAKDPVCGMTVAVGSETAARRVRGRDLPFLLGKVPDEVSRRIRGSTPRAAPKGSTKAAPANVQYTCPMHPEIVRDAPGPARSAAWR